ncbi:MAG TPA: hypothetical protein PKW16_08905 [Treponemataceae bacterium]|nr:hypothetical protein [Treponemataceae bacterium]
MINTWNESALHERLKTEWCGPHGSVEVPMHGVICDAVRQDGSIVEIQTTGFGKIRKKLELLLCANQVELVYPIAVNLRIQTCAADGTPISCRKSPKHGSVYQLFGELTGICDLVGHPNLSITAVFADVLERRVNDGTGSWRRKGIRIDSRELETIRDTRTFRSLSDFSDLLPENLPQPFTVADLNKAGAGRHAGKMAWVLRKRGCIVQTGKNKNAFLYMKS